MATAASHLTAEEFQRLPNPPAGRHELRHGEPVVMPPPTKVHAVLQRRLLFLLDARCGARYYVAMEFASRPLPQHEVWIADIAMVEHTRWNATGDREWLAGSPDLVIEVFSPSNSLREMTDRRNIFFEGGCQQFWLVKPAANIVEVMRPDRSAQLFRAGDAIALDAFG